jgi:Tim44-like domain
MDGRTGTHVGELDIRARVTEVWHEEGQDYVTAHIVGVLVDDAADAPTGALVVGSKAVPQDIESFWTFTRPTGLNPWLSRPSDLVTRAVMAARLSSALRAGVTLRGHSARGRAPSTCPS